MINYSEINNKYNFIQCAHKINKLHVVLVIILYLHIIMNAFDIMLYIINHK